MILLCPHCSTQFFVDDGSIGEGGRTVRCGKCAHIWEQTAEPAQPPPPPQTTVEPPPPQTTVEPAPPPQTTVVPPPPPPEPKTEPPTKPKRRGAGRAWVLVVLIVAAIVGGGYYFPQRLVDLWPPMAKLYEKIGIAVVLPPGYGLALESKNRRDVVGGVPVLVIEGSIKNRSGRPRPMPRLRFTLRDAKGKALQDWTLKPGSGSLADGESRSFKTKFKNPDKDAVDISIEFVAGD